MRTLSGRTFVQLSSRAALSDALSQVFGFTDAPSISNQPWLLRVMGSNHSWENFRNDATFRLRDSRNRLIASGKLQLAVVVASASDLALKQCNLRKAAALRIERGSVTVGYGWAVCRGLVSIRE